jgi:hypothetical protein
MPEQIGDLPQRGAAAVKARGEGPAQDVRARPALGKTTSPIGFDQPEACRSYGQRSAAKHPIPQEEPIIRTGCPSRLHVSRDCVRDVGGKRQCSPTAGFDGWNGQRTVFEVHVGKAQPHDLSDAQTEVDHQ